MFIIGQNLKYVHVIYSSHDFFDLLLMNCIRYFLFDVWFAATSKKYCAQINAPNNELNKMFDVLPKITPIVP